eukprot:gene4112-2926_t
MSADNEEETTPTFAELGVSDALCRCIESLGWTQPTEIQAKVLPHALAGKDVVGLAETGSGKTGAFSIPIIHFLLQSGSRLFALILTPTRELALQINEVVQALGASIGLSSLCLVGGIEMVDQAIALAKRPHIIIATPGRLLDHLRNTKGFNLRTLKFLVIDEADRMLSLDFEKEIQDILRVIPEDRRSYLFSATMTKKVSKLQKLSLKDPAMVEVSNKMQTPKSLIQQYVFVPAKWKDCYLTSIINDFQGQKIIMFVATCNNATRTSQVLRNLGFHSICLHGQLSQPKRLGALNKFRAGSQNILVATDVAARGLDIPAVDMVINFDVPMTAKDYVHRVGRTARAGKAGRAITFVTQYDVEAYQHLEAQIGTKLDVYGIEEERALLFLERVNEAQRMATRDLRDQAKDHGGKHRKRKRDDAALDDDHDD